MIQRSNKWFKARACRITASRFGDVMAGYNTKRYQNYLEEIIDNLSGIPVFNSDKPWFEHGVKMEPDAKRLYEWEMFKNGIDCDLEDVGLIVHPKYDFVACSPDGIFMAFKRGIEIKSRISHAAHLKSKKNGLPAENKHQVQGSIWICENHPDYMIESWDYVSYFEDPDRLIDTDMYIKNILPDHEYHKKLEERCLEFWDKVQKG